MKKSQIAVTVLFLVPLGLGLAFCESATDRGRAYFENLKRRAEAGEAEAQSGLANIYRGHNDEWTQVNGTTTTVRMTTKGIVAEDPQAAVKWYRKAADQGHGEAAFKLAQMHHYPNVNWEGFTPSLREALKWYRKAVVLGLDGVQKEIAAKSIRELTEKWKVAEEAGKKIAPLPKKK
jgi:TPR repeat protein